MASRRPLRVALLATSVEFGGIERVLLNMVQHMDREVELVPVVFTRTDTSTNSFFDRLRALAVPYETLYVNSTPPHGILSPVVNLVQALRLVRKGGFNLIHSHGYRADVFAIALSKLTRTPVVSTVHGFIGNDWRLRFYNALDARVLRAFSQVIAVSAPMKAELVAHGVSPDRVHVIANAVAEVPPDDRLSARGDSRRRLGITEAEFVFGYVGRLSDEKGVGYLLEAVRTLAADCEQSRIVIVGDGPARGELESAAADPLLKGRVMFAGFQRDTASWYSAMDALVLPSLTEGTPMALLEGMAAGLPVIASRVGGVPDVVAGEEGILVAPGDVAELRAAMTKILRDPVLRAGMSDRARLCIRNRYGLRSWVRQTLAVYAAATADRQQRLIETRGYTE